MKGRLAAGKGVLIATHADSGRRAAKALGDNVAMLVPAAPNLGNDSAPGAGRAVHKKAGKRHGRWPMHAGGRTGLFARTRQQGAGLHKFCLRAYARPW